jgi:hypothetical protein
MSAAYEPHIRVERPGPLTAGKVDDETLRCLVSAAAASGYRLDFNDNEARS